MAPYIVTRAKKPRMSKKWGWAVEPQGPSPSDSFLQQASTSYRLIPQPSQTMSPNGDQMLKLMSQWGTFYNANYNMSLGSMPPPLKIDSAVKVNVEYINTCLEKLVVIPQALICPGKLNVMK